MDHERRRKILGTLERVYEKFLQTKKYIDKTLIEIRQK